MRTFSLFTDSIFTLGRLFFNFFDFGNCSNHGVLPIEIIPYVSHQKEIEVDGVKSQAVKNKEISFHAATKLLSQLAKVQEIKQQLRAA